MKTTLASLLLLAGSLAVTHPADAGQAFQIAAGGNTSCAIVDGGEVACWGDNFLGALGSGATGSTLPQSATPVRVMDAASNGQRLRNMRQVSLGQDATWPTGCAVSAVGRVWCWGSNRSGALGNEAASMSLGRAHARPVRLNNADLMGMTQVAVGGQHTCALRNDGKVLCWGIALANGATADSHVPAVVRTASGELANVVQLAAGREFTCARGSDRSVHCWGRNSHSELAQDAGSADAGSAVALPALYPASHGANRRVNDATELSAGEAHACLITAAGRMSCWGRNAVGENNAGATLGSGTPTPAIQRWPGVFAQIAASSPLATVRLLAAGGHHTCARDGVLGAGPSLTAIYCTGANSHGQIGNQVASGGATAWMTEVRQNPSGNSTGFRDVVALAAGERHSCALDLTGRVRCWGRNHRGQLGRGSIGGNDEAFPWPTPGTADVAGLNGAPGDLIFGDGLQGYP